MQGISDYKARQKCGILCFIHTIHDGKNIAKTLWDYLDIVTGQAEKLL